jgi:hypothetical protein
MNPYGSLLYLHKPATDPYAKPDVWGRGEVHTGFWWGDLREGDHLEDPGVDGRIILKLIFKKGDGRAWTGSMWLRIGTGGGLL